MGRGAACANRRGQALRGLDLATTKRFNRAFNDLSEQLQQMAVQALRQFRDEPARSGLGLEKINVTRSKSIRRLRINQSCRVHFRGSVAMPELVNVGNHRLYEHGRAIG